MALTGEERQTLVEGIISNCDCWEDDDREVLNSFSDGKLTMLAKHVIDENKEEFSNNAEDSKAKVSSPGDMSDDDLEAEMEKRMAGKKKGMMAKNQVTDLPNLSPEEWIQRAPTEVQNTFRYAYQIEQQEKDKIIKQLVANLSGDTKRTQEERLQKRSLEELRGDLTLIPKPEQPKPTGNAAEDGSWLKNMIGSAASHKDEFEPLLLPTINYEQEGSIGTFGMSGASARAEHSPDEEWMRKAPASVRSLVENAARIERREKDTMIEQITANVADTGERLRLKDRLSEKSIEELRDLASLTRGMSTSRGKANYSGAAAPAANQALGEEERGDILMLPTMSFEQVDPRKKA